MTRTLLLILALPSAVAVAAEPPFAHGDAAAGKTLAERDCVACHARLFEGDAERIYTRPDHKVRSSAQLAAQIAYCNTQLGTQYFPEEEAHVGAYLNQRYYRFNP